MNCRAWCDFGRIQFLPRFFLQIWFAYGMKMFVMAPRSLDAMPRLAHHEDVVHIEGALDMIAPTRIDANGNVGKSSANPNIDSF